MSLSVAERSKRYRDRKRGGPPREPQPCGTLGGLRRHEKEGPVTCPACIAYRSEHNHEMYELRKSRRNVADRG